MNKKLFMIITVLGMAFAGSVASMKKEEKTKTSQNASPGNPGDSIGRVCPGAPRIDRRKRLNRQDPRVQAVRRRLALESDDEGEQE